MNTKRRKMYFLYAAVVLGLLIVPWFTGNYLTYLINLSGIYTISILGLNLLMGRGGQVFFGGVAMMAIGAYVSALLAKHFGIPFYLSIPLSGIITSILGLSIIFPALRVKGLYLAMVSIGFHVITDQVLAGWDTLTGGRVGIFLPSPTLAGFDLGSDRAYYYVVMITVLVSLWTVSNINRMRVGRAIWTIGQSPTSASVMGINLVFYKIIAFMLCAFYCGIAGALLANYLQFISPDIFTVAIAIMLLVGMIIGGWGSVGGSVVGGFFVTFLPILISFVKDSLFGSTTALYDLETMISGIVIVIVVLFIPMGVAESIKNMRLRWGNNVVLNKGGDRTK